MTATHWLFFGLGLSFGLTGGVTLRDVFDLYRQRHPDPRQRKS